MPKPKPTRKPRLISKPLDQPLDHEKRLRLKEIFTDPVFQQAMANMLLRKPSSFVAGLTGKGGSKIALLRMGEIRGWEQYEAALILQAEEPVTGKRFLEETYPDSGRLDWEPKSAQDHSK
jgi:hypothetical protein